MWFLWWQWATVRMSITKPGRAGRLAGAASSGSILPTRRATRADFPTSWGGDLFSDQVQELPLVEDRELQLVCLLELRPGARPRDYVIGLRAHARRGLTAEPAYQRLGLGPAHPVHGPGEHERLARQRPIARRVRRLRLHAGGDQAPHQLSPLPLEVLLHLARHARADALDRVQLRGRRGPQLFDAAELHGQQVGRRLAHLRDAKRIEEPAQ